MREQNHARLASRLASLAGLMAISGLCSTAAPAQAAGTNSVQPPLAAGTSSYGAPADFDCDGRADISRRIHNGIWEIDLAEWNGFGRRDVVVSGYGDGIAIPVPADYDGDCRADLSVKAADGYWFIDYAADGFFGWDAVYPGYGPDTSVPVPADYDGDGRADLSVKGEDGNWYIDYAANGFGQWNAIYPGYGPASSVPVPADYDGDLIADLSVKAADGCWHIDYAAGGFGQWNEIHCGYGPPSSLAVPADYDGDGIADLSVRAAGGTWYIDYAAGGFGAWNAIYPYFYGSGSEEPVPADYDGDGRADLSLHSDDEYWYIDYSANGVGRESGGYLLPWDFQDALAVPVIPTIELEDPTAHSVKFRVSARDSDLEGRSAASTIETGLLGQSGTSHTTSGTSVYSEFKNLKANTNYCMVAVAVNSEGYTGKTVCFKTDKAPAPPPPPPPPTTHGFKRVDVFNCHVERRALHVWTRDVTQSNWVHRGTVAPHPYESCSQAPAFGVTLQDQHSYWVVAVDPGLSSCGENDPENGACQRSYFLAPIPGDPNGPVKPMVVN